MAAAALTVQVLQGGDVRHAAVVALRVLQGGALGRGAHGARGAPPRVPPDRRRGPQEVAPRLAAAPLAALVVAVAVGQRVAVGHGVVVLLGRQGEAVADGPGVRELAVGTGALRALAVLQQVRGGGVREGAAAPRAVLVRLGALRLEAAVLLRIRGEEDKPKIYILS